MIKVPLLGLSAVCDKTQHHESNLYYGCAMRRDISFLLPPLSLW